MGRGFLRSLASDRNGELLAEVQPYLASVLQWKMTLNSSARSEELSSSDLTIEGYQVVTSDSFSKGISV